MPRAGTLIALDGSDAAALDVLLERLYRWLRERGVPAERAQAPTRSPIGALLRLEQQGRLELDPACLALLWAADRLDQLGREGGLRTSLEQGCVVLAVRYLLYGYGLLLDRVDLAWLERINTLCNAPDLTLYVGPLSAGAVLGARGELLLEVAERKGGRVARVVGCETLDAAEAACRQHIITELGHGEVEPC